MKELRSIVDTYDKIDFSKHKAALATVVRVLGSSYRRTGARMIIIDDGRWTGAISGGCLEGDALRKARQAILLKKPSVVTYDTMEDKDAMNLGVGLGCNGVIDVLIEPIDDDNPVQIEFLKKILKDNKPAVLATVYSSSLHDAFKIGKQWMLDEHLHHENNLLPSEENYPDFFPELLNDMKEVELSATSNSFEYYNGKEDKISVFVEYLKPPIHLIIFGGGYDAIPILNFSKQLGWSVTVTDDCVAHIAPVRFPNADDLLHASRYEVVEKLEINKYTAAVLLSHNYKYDLAVFKELLHTKIPYIGILGPRKKFDKMLEQMQQEGVYLDEETMEKIHAPVGLDIGAELPEEIAISILAEVQAKINNCSGKMLRSKDGPIHGKSNEEKISSGIF